ASALGDGPEATGLRECALHDGLVEMMAAALAGNSLDVEPSGRKHPLPGPLAAGVRILASQRPRQLDPACALPEVEVVLLLDDVQMPGQLDADDGRKRRGPVFVAFAGADDDLIAPEIDILHSEPSALQEAQARAVQQDGHETGSGAELTANGPNRVAGEHDR